MSGNHASSGLRIVGLGGTVRPNSSTEKALRVALHAAAAEGAETQLFDGPFLAKLPHYDREKSERTAEERSFVEAVRTADALIVASPGYHAGISGLVKNALDLLEDTAGDQRVYLDGIAVGLIVTAHGWQATASTLAALRAVVHALRAWPTPLGACINSAGGVFDAQGGCTVPQMEASLKIVGSQVVGFARRQRASADQAASLAAAGSPTA